MIRINRLSILGMFTMFFALTSCVQDEGNNILSDVNDLEIDGIEDEYTRVANAESLQIDVKLDAKLTGNDETKFDYLWFMHMKTQDDQDSIVVIGKDKNLNYPVNVAPGKYYIVFRATDKQTKMQWEKDCLLSAISPFVQGFYLFGNKDNGQCGLDFVSMIEAKDTTVIADIWKNDQQMKNAVDLVFTGGADPFNTNLWAIGQSTSTAVENSASKTVYHSLPNIKLSEFVYPTIPVQEPMKLREILPHPYGKNNLNMARANRFMLTDHEIFFTSMYGPPEVYGNPINRYSGTSSTLFEPAPYGFYPGNSRSPSTMAFFDKTNHKFVRVNGAYYAMTNCADYADSETPFYVDQTHYTPVRDLVYGENGYGNRGRSYALMNDADGNYFVYCFLIKNYTGSGMEKIMARPVDKAVATHIASARLFAFFSMQPVLLYAVRNELWAYDYVRNVAKKVQTFAGEITYLAMDFHSNESPTDFIVATYSNAEKGVVRKFTIADDPNDIHVTEHTYKTKSYPWKTNLRVVKIVYRNSTI